MTGPAVDASIGSGSILSQDGLILTNAHVAGPKAVEINVTLSNLERVGARLVGWDHWTDLSLLRLNLDDVKARASPSGTPSSATATSSTWGRPSTPWNPPRAHPHRHPRHHLQQQPLL